MPDYFFSVKQYFKKQEKKYSKSHRIKFWIPEFFYQWFEFFQKIDFKLYFLVFLHLSKSHKSNVIVPLHFVFTVLFHILISCKVINKIKNRNLQHNFLEICDISVKSEQIGQIGANLVKVGPKGKFCKTISDIYYLCINKAIRMINK